MKTLRTILPLLVLAVTSRGYADVRISVGHVTAVAGATAEVPVTISSDGIPPAAMAFAIEFDQTRLAFDSAAKDGSQLRNVAIDASPDIRGSASAMQVDGRERIALAMWRNAATSAPFTATVRLRFTTFRDASGSAWVRVADDASASSSSGALVSLSTTDGSVTFMPSTRVLLAAPQILDFGHLDSGSRSIRTIVLTNGGTSDLTIGGIIARGEGITASVSTPFDVPSGASRTITVAFTETEAGIHQGSVTFTYGEGLETTVPTIATSGESSEAVAHLRSLLVPVAARSLTADGSGWTTSLVLQSPVARSRTSITLISGGTQTRRTIELEEGETRSLNDALAWLGNTADSSGYLVIAPSSPDVVVSAFAVEHASAAVRQSIELPVVALSDIPRDVQSINIASPSRTTRLDAGVVNFGSVPLNVRLEAFDAAGVQIFSAMIAADPGSVVRTNGLPVAGVASLRAQSGNEASTFLLWTSQSFEGAAPRISAGR